MNIYISNLSYGVQDASLQDLFSAFGEVSSAKVITDKFSGRSRGFGFVEMTDDAEGQKAIDELNNSQFEGRTISVNVAKPREERPRNFAPRGGNNRY
ncbi:MAG: RNA-binding protein [Muribaculaceae bacterium]